MDGILGYTSLPRQQLLALDPNIYGGEPFRHGLTPPQLSSEQMHSYGEEGRVENSEGKKNSFFFFVHRLPQHVGSKIMW